MLNIKSFLFGRGIRLTYLPMRHRVKYLNVNYLRRGDTFMCSYPRSGNTWTRMIVACLLEPEIKSIDLDLIDQLVPEAGRHPPATTEPRVFKQHLASFDCFPKVIYNYRDGRDCVLSAYKYAMDTKGYTGSMLEFLVDRTAQPFGFWHEHIEKALDFQSAFADRILMLPYEKMRNNPAESIAEIAGFLHLRVSDQRIDDIRLMTALTRQKSEKQYSEPTKKYTLGRGVIGSWREMMTETEIKVFQGISRSALQRLGYELWPANQEL